MIAKSIKVIIYLLTVGWSTYQFIWHIATNNMIMLYRDPIYFFLLALIFFFSFLNLMNELNEH